MVRPLILVSNDDGILAPGLTVMVDALAELGDIIVCAPEAERSGSGHAISFHTHLRAHELRSGWWHVSGTPVDCVYFALLHLCPRRPDLVCSGINAGFNLGSDVFYSGTVGAAAEGYMRGVSALAVSGERGAEGPLHAAPVAHAVAAALLEAPTPLLLNLNVPAPPAGGLGPRELVVTRLGQRKYRDGVQPRTDPMGRPYYWIGGPPEQGSTDREHDTGAVAAGLCSLTPLHLDLTAPDLQPAHALLDRVRIKVPEGSP